MVEIRAVDDDRKYLAVKVAGIDGECTAVVDVDEAAVLAANARLNGAEEFANELERRGASAC